MGKKLLGFELSSHIICTRTCEINETHFKQIKIPKIKAWNYRKQYIQIHCNLLVDEKKLFSTSLAFVDSRISAFKYLLGIKRLFRNF